MLTPRPLPNNWTKSDLILSDFLRDYTAKLHVDIGLDSQQSKILLNQEWLIIYER